MIHDLKCWPEYFQAVKSGIKPFELRKDDRGYAVGDVLHLREFDPDTALYTGDEIDKTVTYVLPTKLFGELGEGAKYVIMGLAPRDWTPCSEGLPEFTNFYNVTVGVGGMLGYYEETRTYRYLKIKGEEPKWVIPDRFDEVVHVLAWQPLPKPYNPDRKEDAECKE